jgi:AraC-like DNA-binding protein
MGPLNDFLAGLADFYVILAEIQRISLRDERDSQPAGDQIQEGIEIAHRRVLFPNPKDDELELAEVALRVGFSDQSKFSFHFKRLIGVTPRQFRLSAKIV